MKRHTFFPGADPGLVKALGKKFETIKNPGEDFSAVVGDIEYSGPVKQQDGNINWHVKHTALAKQAKQSAPAKATPKKVAAKKAAAKKTAPKKSAKK